MLKNKGTDKMIKCEQEDIYRELVNKADNKEHYRSLIREHTQQEDINEELLTDIWNEYCPQGQQTYGVYDKTLVDTMSIASFNQLYKKETNYAKFKH